MGAVVLALVFLAVPVAAHVPSFPVDNTTPERAVAVPDAVKSWSFYDTVGEGQAKYYRMTLAPGERLQVGTFTPLASGFTPSLVVMSPSVNGTDDVPAQVTVPDGMGAVVVDGERPAGASYEPFAPSANYHTAGITRPVDTETTYLVAIYDRENRSGPAGVTVGYAEEFALTEYLTVPFDLVRTHLWEGQSILVAIGPFLLTVFGGGGLLLSRWRSPSGQTAIRVLVGVAGLVILGSGVNTVVQMGIALSRTGSTSAALVTAAFVVLPVVCGLWIVRFSLSNELAFPPSVRGGLAIAGVVSLLTWGGFIVAPVVVLVLSLTPGRLLTA